MDPQHGLSTWSLGLSRIVDVVLALHARDELEVATLSAASMACSECWTTAGSFKGMQDSRAKVREIGNKLKKLLDPNRRTYKGLSSALTSKAVAHFCPGELVYAP
jgi:hypothetical protein